MSKLVDSPLLAFPFVKMGRNSGSCLVFHQGRINNRKWWGGYLFFFKSCWTRLMQSVYRRWVVSVIRGRKEREAQLAASPVLLLLLLLLLRFFKFFFSPKRQKNKKTKKKIPNLCIVELVSVPPLTYIRTRGLEI